MIELELVDRHLKRMIAHNCKQTHAELSELVKRHMELRDSLPECVPPLAGTLPSAPVGPEAPASRIQEAQALRAETRSDANPSTVSAGRAVTPQAGTLPLWIDTINPDSPISGIAATSAAAPAGTANADDD